MTEKTEKKINDINVTMKLEGMPLTVNDKDILRRCLEGELSFNEECSRIFQEIRQLNG